MNLREISSKIRVGAKPNKIHLGLDERRPFLKQLLAGVTFFSVLINIYVFHRLTMKGMDRSMIIASSSVFFLGCIQLGVILSALRKHSVAEDLNATELIELQHHAYLGKLSAGVFHDLVNRLTAMILHVQQIPQSICPSTKTSESIDKAISAAKRAESFITLVDKRIHFRDRIEVFSLNSELEDTLTLLAYELRKAGTEPEIHAAEPIWIRGNVLIFRQAMISLSFAILHSKHRMFQIDTSRSQKHLRISIRYNTSNTLAKSIPQSSEFCHAKILIETSFKGKVMHCRRFERGSIVLELPSDAIGQASFPHQSSEHKYDTDCT